MAIYGLYVNCGHPTITVLHFNRTWDSFKDVEAAAESEARRSLYEGRNYDAIFAVENDNMVIWRLADLLR